MEDMKNQKAGPSAPLYFAYGSNLNLEGFANRCPAAEPAAAHVLEDWRLVFRYHADIEPEAGSAVAGALYYITEDCERALDRYEGVGAGYYRKEYIDTPLGRALVYVMTRKRRSRYQVPSSAYYATCAMGMRSWGLPEKQMQEALEHAFENDRELAVDQMEFAS